MTQKQQNRLSRDKATIEVLDQNAQYWAGINSFKKAHDELNASIVARENALKIQVLPTTGITEDKESDTVTAINLVVKLAINGSAYAMEVGNHDLEAQLNFSFYQLFHLPDNELVARLNKMIEAVSLELPNMTDYPVSAADVTAAQAAATKAAGELADPRTAVTRHATATNSILTYEAAGRHANKRMDKLVLNFQQTSPDFVTQYRMARIIVDSGIRHEKKEPLPTGKQDGTTA